MPKSLEPNNLDLQLVRLPLFLTTIENTHIMLHRFRGCILLSVDQGDVKRALRAETTLGLDGTRLKQNIQTRL